MSFKQLHSFRVTIDREVDKVTTRTEGSKEITETTKVIEPVICTIILKDPSRKEKTDVSLFKSIMQNDAVALGLMPQLLMIQKLSKEPGNPLSGAEDKSLMAMTVRLQELANEYIRLNVGAEVDTPETRERKERINNEYLVLQQKVIDINTAYQSVFAHTAERYAEGKVLAWLALYLTYLKTGPDSYRPFFEGADFEAKEDKLGDLEDQGDPIYLAMVEKLSTFWMWYYYGVATTSAQFAEKAAEWEKQLAAEKQLKEETQKRLQELAAKSSEVPVTAPVETVPAAPAPEEIKP